MLITHGGRPAAGGGRSAAGGGRSAAGTGKSANRIRPDRIRLGRQALIVAAAVTAYFLVRGATEAAFTEAVRNARRVVDLEKLLGMYHEQALQSAVADSPTVTTVLNWIYIWGHWPVIVATLLWLGLRHPSVFLRTRNAMLVSGAIGLVVFVSFPVAPPRLAGLGLVDTVTVSSEAYRVLQPPMFTNQYAAMPSLHVGWDLLIGLAVFTAARRPLVRALGLLMPVAMFVAVVLTANHYIIDAIIGAGLTATFWVLCGRWLRLRGRHRAAVFSRPEAPVLDRRFAAGSAAELHAGSRNGDHGAPRSGPALAPVAVGQAEWAGGGIPLPRRPGDLTPAPPEDDALPQPALTP